MSSLTLFQSSNLNKVKICGFNLFPKLPTEANIEPHLNCQLRPVGSGDTGGGLEHGVRWGDRAGDGLEGGDGPEIGDRR